MPTKCLYIIARGVTATTITTSHRLRWSDKFLQVIHVNSHVTSHDGIFTSGHEIVPVSVPVSAFLRGQLLPDKARPCSKWVVRLRDVSSPWSGGRRDKKQFDQRLLLAASLLTIVIISKGVRYYQSCDSQRTASYACIAERSGTSPHITYHISALATDYHCRPGAYRTARQIFLALSQEERYKAYNASCRRHD